VGSVPVWLVGLIFSRDVVLFIASGIAYRFMRMRRFPPSVFGKAATFFQIACAASVIGAEAGLPLQTLGRVLVWPAAALTAFSGVHYLVRGARR
jgi:phosphatidylglycerophosphate synthase